MKMKAELESEEVIIEAYKCGQSMNSLAKTFGTYTSTIQRILEKNKVALRHDSKNKGELYVKDGEKLIEWAKAQKRLVSKEELAEQIGRKRLSPSYFEKYPELGKYVIPRNQKELEDYNNRLYSYLKELNIPYKPNDRTKLKVAVDALLLGEYTGLAIQINIKPKCVSNKQYAQRINDKKERAKKANLIMLYIGKKDLENIETIKRYIAVGYSLLLKTGGNNASI